MKECLLPAQRITGRDTPCPARQYTSVRILYSADLHYALRQFDWMGRQVPAFDLAVLAGDLLDISSAVDLEVQEVVVQKYLRKFSEERTLLVSSGNHDIQQVSPEGERTAEWMESLEGPTLISDYSWYEEDEVLFTICSWWDGPVTRSRVEKLLEEGAARPKKTWVWLHHNPPAGTPVAWTGKKDVGDPVVVEWIKRYSPDLVFSGHIHNAPFFEQGGWYARLGNSWAFNPGKQPGEEPARIIVDLKSRRAEWFSVEGIESVEF